MKIAGKSLKSNKPKERILFIDTLFHDPVLTAYRKTIDYTE